MSSAPTRTLSDSSQHADTLRKRVGKACDRCRLKKSKCDGSSPCSRCRQDNALCVFGDRKKAQDKVYPKGYVEMLEQNQTQLVAGLKEAYQRLLAARLWPGEPLDEREGHPLTHDILTALDILHHKSDGSVDVFEDDPEKLQRRLVSSGAPYMHRRGSISSDSDRSTTHSHKRPRSTVDSPISSPAQSFEKSFTHDRPTSHPSNARTTSLTNKSRHPKKPSPLHTESPVVENMPIMDEDALMSAWSWQDIPSDATLSQEPQFTFPGNQSFNMLDTWSGLPPQGFDAVSTGQWPSTGIAVNQDFTTMQQIQKEPMDLDLSRYMPVAS